MAKRNADIKTKSKGLRIFIMSLNLWDLALNKKKLKTKPKALASCKDGNERFPCPRTTLSRTVATN